MTNAEEFDKLVLDGDLGSAVKLAVWIARGKASRSGRSAWLSEVRKLRPDLENQIQRADRFGDFEDLMIALNERI